MFLRHSRCRQHPTAYIVYHTQCSLSTPLYIVFRKTQKAEARIPGFLRRKEIIHPMQWASHRPPHI